MKKQAKKPENTTFLLLKYLARILGSLTLVFILIFFLGIISSSSNEPLPTFTESIGFLFYPIGFAIGLIIAYKNELLGGIINLVSFVFFVIFIFILREIFIISRDFSFFIFLAIPGVLYLVVGILQKMHNINNTFINKKNLNITWQYWSGLL